MSWVTVSAKIRRDLYEKLKKHGIRVSEVIKRALDEEVARKEEEEARKALEDAGRILSKIPPEEIVEAVRTSRDER